MYTCASTCIKKNGSYIVREIFLLAFLFFPLFLEWNLISYLQVYSILFSISRSKYRHGDNLSYSASRWKHEYFNIQFAFSKPQGLFRRKGKIRLIWMAFWCLHVRLFFQKTIHDCIAQCLPRAKISLWLTMKKKQIFLKLLLVIVYYDFPQSVLQQ